MRVQPVQPLKLLSFSAQRDNSNSLLLLQPSGKATVEVVPYRIVNGEVYVLLGRERIDGKGEKAGQYSGFGGNMEGKDNFGLQAARECQEGPWD